ncbi:hypothetical protein [Clostridium sp. AM58-1XD]|uniref:DUF6985 domain-containing protein n=1 Tax=Clostridium sp. AM58-1XD TaxID=2292307 RepID=UPI0011C11C26|nr:hypothetical protein [Clostridium sp. AM58-1XD]
MMDLVFGELTKDGDDYYSVWRGKKALDFGGTLYAIDLEIEPDNGEGGITEKQREAFQYFIEKWSELQSKLIESLIVYYNEEERFAWGPDDEKELAEWWPEIETKEALLQAVTLETIVVPGDSVMDRDKGRYIYLLFSRTWGGEDYDDNGIGVGFLNEEIERIGYKDIAY